MGLRCAQYHIQDGSGHDDTIKWTFSVLLAICEGNHRSPVDSPHKGQWRGALMFFLSAPEQTAEQIIEAPVIWDAITLIMTSQNENEQDSWMPSGRLILDSSRTTQVMIHLRGCILIFKTTITACVLLQTNRHILRSHKCGNKVGVTNP